MLNESSSNDDMLNESSSIDEESKIKQRIAIYAPTVINDKLQKMAKEKKISKNKLALQIITTFMDKNIVI